MNLQGESQGIYVIVNIYNNKIYIGSTVNFKKRKRQHWHLLKQNNHHSRHLQNSWNKYGKECFKFLVLENVDDKCDLKDREQYWIDYYKSYDLLYGYNMYKTANSPKGVKVSEETRRKLRELSLGKRNAFYGKHHTDETKLKMSVAKKGMAITQSQKDGLAYGRGNKFHTAKTYEKLSKANRGEGSATSKLKEIDVINILKEIKQGVYYKDISQKYSISLCQISRIKNRIRWGYLYEQYPELY